MIKQILNIGSTSFNSDTLNRKIRVSNLISFITIVTMIGYIPIAITFKMTGIIVLNSFFMLTSFFSFYLNYRNKYSLSFYINCIYGLIYFVFGTVLYGLESNLQFFMLIMCLISIALFENVIILRIFVASAVVSFFIMVIGLKNQTGFMALTDEMKKAQGLIGVVNLFILFIITILFFSFFRRENIIFQKAILKQKAIIEEKQKEILDSINYAKRIQYALLASEELLNKNLNNHFVLFKPKDIVSGDFYWATNHKNKFYLAVCDSTGHGVPGAFMSLLNIGFLSEAIKDKGIEEPHEIFNYVRDRLIESIGKDEQQDGMDGILICIDKSTNLVSYASANNSPVLVRQNEIIELGKDKMPVGKGERLMSFKLYQMTVQKGDILYLYTDGYADQFGGPKGKKFKYKQLNGLLINNSSLNVGKQMEELEQHFLNWSGVLEQVDDVCVIGIKF